MANHMKTKLKLCLMSLTCAAASASAAQPDMKTAVDAAIAPLRTQYGIPGVAVGITVGGKHAFYNYGVASKAMGAPAVDNETLFELGSLTKTFTATLACRAQTSGKLSFDAPASQYVSALRGSPFDRVSVLNLGTHTSGLPLFVPDNVTNGAQMTAWLRDWQPPGPIGSRRVYSNLGIGLLGRALTPPLPPQNHALLNKTGSTNGFSTYVAFIPGQQIGVVILANKSYPNEARVKAAYAIIDALTGAKR